MLFTNNTGLNSFNNIERIQRNVMDLRQAVRTCTVWTVQQRSEGLMNVHSLSERLRASANDLEMEARKFNRGAKLLKRALIVILVTFIVLFVIIVSLIAVK